MKLKIGIILTAFLFVTNFAHATNNPCWRDGWKEINVTIDGYNRSVLWKAPKRKWRHGAIIVLHGGGGSHHHFCRGGKLVQPQIDFTRRAISQGFAVFVLDSTNDIHSKSG